MGWGLGGLLTGERMRLVMRTLQQAAQLLLGFQPELSPAAPRLVSQGLLVGQLSGTARLQQLQGLLPPPGQGQMEGPVLLSLRQASPQIQRQTPVIQLGQRTASRKRARCAREALHLTDAHRYPQRSPV